MNKTLIIAIAVVACVGLAFYFLRNTFKEPEETTTVFCGPDKSLPAIVFRNPTKAFPSFATEYTSKITANIAVMDSLVKISSGSGGGSVDLNKKIVELRDKLNNESSRMEMLMKSNFFAYNSKPCDSAVSRRYFDFLVVMAEKNAELEQLKAGVTTAVTTTTVDSSAKRTIIKDTAKIREELNKFTRRYDFQKTALLLNKDKINERVVNPRLLRPEN